MAFGTKDIKAARLFDNLPVLFYVGSYCRRLAFDLGRIGYVFQLAPKSSVRTTSKLHASAVSAACVSTSNT